MRFHRLPTTLTATLALLLGVAVAPARAADNVTEGAIAASGSAGLGTVHVSANFDNTNCDPHSTNNCSGANGATLDYVVVSISNNASLAQDNLLVDVWGDGTSSYVDVFPANWVWQGVIDGRKTWRSDPVNHNNVRRVLIPCHTAGATGSLNVSLNPFGY